MWPDTNKKENWCLSRNELKEHTTYLENDWSPEHLVVPGSPSIIFIFASFSAAAWEEVRIIQVLCTSNTTEKHITQVGKASRSTNLCVVKTCTTATSATPEIKNKAGGGEARPGTDHRWRWDDTRWIIRQMRGKKWTATNTVPLPEHLGERGVAVIWPGGRRGAGGGRMGRGEG